MALIRTSTSTTITITIKTAKAPGNTTTLTIMTTEDHGAARIREVVDHHTNHNINKHIKCNNSIYPHTTAPLQPNTTRYNHSFIQQHRHIVNNSLNINHNNFTQHLFNILRHYILNLRLHPHSHLCTHNIILQGMGPILPVIPPMDSIRYLPPSHNTALTRILIATTWIRDISSIPDLWPTPYNPNNGISSASRCRGSRFTTRHSGSTTRPSRCLHSAYGTSRL